MHRHVGWLAAAMASRRDDHRACGGDDRTEEQVPGQPPWGRRGGPWPGGSPGTDGPPWAAFLAGARGNRGGMPGLAPFGGWRTTKARRGDVRTAVLAVLAEEPRNGYQIIQEIGERSGGAWKPSPGSIYPTLQQLEDEGLVQADQPQGRRTFQLTEGGRQYVAEHADEVRDVWSSAADGGGDGRDDMRGMIGQVAGAAVQVAMVGTPAQRAEARDILVDARRRLYGILADGDPDDEG